MDPVSSAATRAGGRLLVVDDQRNMRTTTALVLRQEGYAVDEASSGEEALRMIEAAPAFDLVLTDLRMAPMDGLELVRRILELSPGTQVVVMTAYGTIESAVEAMRRGAADYVTKPFQGPELLVRVSGALERRRLLHEVTVLTGEFRSRYGLDNILGASAAIRDLVGRIARVAPSDATVLVMGESGTGKELVARALHAASRRALRPFVPINCAAITPTLLESELFGHARGAFTGAVKARRGLYEEADGGTLFLDEIAETEPGFQSKLLRALQEGEIRRVGESVSVTVDVRVVAATNQDLRRAIAEKRFREDLFYRLNVVPIRVPPLRERIEDIPLLAAHFLQRFARRAGGPTKRLSDGAMEKLVSHNFPGNVRELENVLEQAAALSLGDEIGADDFELGIADEPGGPPGASDGPRRLTDAVDDAERIAIQASVGRYPNDLAAVARELGVSSTTLWRKMKRLGLRGDA